MKIAMIILTGCILYVSGCGTEIGNGVAAGGETSAKKKKSASSAEEPKVANDASGTPESVAHGGSASVPQPAASGGELPTSPAQEAATSDDLVMDAFDRRALFTSCATPFAMKPALPAAPVKLAALGFTATYADERWTLSSLPTEAEPESQIIAFVKGDAKVGPHAAQIFDATEKPLGDHFRCGDVVESDVTLEGDTTPVHRVEVLLKIEDAPYAKLIWYVRDAGLIRIEIDERAGGGAKVTLLP